jgi:hypothetical protein
MTNERLSDERLSYADDNFDAYYAKAAETQKLVRELVTEIKRLRAATESIAPQGFTCKGGKCPEPMWCGQESGCLWDRWNK